ncbi:hypothetical protein [Actinosynnema sp. NPDC020468]|uniref:hypothetical protein n=1 Tax=Actinosynnema sp. NPDC020468 TaxID=3154488 RepID=UPI0033F1026D
MYLTPNGEVVVVTGASAGSGEAARFPDKSIVDHAASATAVPTPSEVIAGEFGARGARHFVREVRDLPTQRLGTPDDVAPRRI